IVNNNLEAQKILSCALYLVPCAICVTFVAMKILMVCLGNICRSPMAEGLLQDKARKAGLKWSVESAGTNGYHINEAPHPLSQKVARINGVDISKQRSRSFVAEDFHRFDKIYAMSDDVIDDMRRIARNSFDEKKVDLLLNELFPGQNVDVPDPWYGPEPGFHQAYKLIEEACEAIIKKASPNPSSSGDFQASLKSKTIDGKS
ncbi:MAG TPA: low molecular weight protein-tyrosine-phosphatase, partial [Chitinophagaceae bacterium]|nr:low molecular weight protein-tyrosine-phosphatase [Chitinophagaceae bacterium]